MTPEMKQIKKILSQTVQSLADELADEASISGAASADFMDRRNGLLKMRTVIIGRIRPMALTVIITPSIQGCPAG